MGHSLKINQYIFGENTPWSRKISKNRFKVNIDLIDEMRKKMQFRMPMHMKSSKKKFSRRYFWDFKINIKMEFQALYAALMNWTQFYKDKKLNANIFILSKKKK